MNVGDYVRTKRGEIHKITDLKPHYENGELILEKQLVYIDNKCSGWNYEQFNEIIVKSSPQIIDLIEKGDYVNGSEVMDADWFNENGEYEEGLAFPLYSEENLHVIVNWLPLKYVEIHSIVTHEQMEAMQYRVEE